MKPTIEIADKIIANEKDYPYEIWIMAKALSEAEKVIQLADDIFDNDKYHIAHIVTHGWLKEHGSGKK